MGLFKEFKDDFSQAMNELVPGGDDSMKMKDNADNLVVDTLGEDVDVKSELSKLDGLLEQVVEEPVIEKKVKREQMAAPIFEKSVEKPMFEKSIFESQVEKPVFEKSVEKPMFEKSVFEKSVYEAPVFDRTIETPVMHSAPVVTPSVATRPLSKEESSRVMNETMLGKNIQPDNVQDETSIITASTVLSGDLQSAGSFDIQGTINGNITCNGKIVVTGVINGNSTASEFFADVAKVEGEVVSSGTVKIGAGSVIIGNISAASAVIAGAVKGDIDVQGPVVVDTSAVVMGNIKSRSVQINNGAVIEGFCSQAYADIDVQGLFDGRE